MCTFLDGFLEIVGDKQQSVTTASWSDTPGMTWTLLTMLGKLVRNKSRMFNPRVAFVTNWDRECSSNSDKKYSWTWSDLWDESPFWQIVITAQNNGEAVALVLGLQVLKRSIQYF